MNYEDWGNQLKKFLSEISDTQWQHAVWVKGSGPEVSSWVELIEGFLEDFSAGSFLDKHGEKLGDATRHALKKLVKAMESFDHQGQTDVQSLT